VPAQCSAGDLRWRQPKGFGVENPNHAPAIKRA
jgi:hypothetical protein